MKPMRRWVNNIKMDITETMCEVADQIKVAQIRVRWRALMDR